MTFLKRWAGTNDSQKSNVLELSLKGLAVVELPNRPIPSSSQTSKGEDYWRSFNLAEVRYRAGNYQNALDELTRLDGLIPLHKTGYAFYLKCLRKVRKLLLDGKRLSEAVEVSRRILEHPNLESTATDDRTHNKIVVQLAGPDSDHILVTL